MFTMPLGIDIPDISGLKSAYEISRGNEGCISALLSADKLSGFINSFVSAMAEPIFFFIELPCTADEEKALGGKYKLYYLDNCTKPVIAAIMKTYGTLLINDGVCRFGFGGNESGDELYVQSYKVMSIYCSNAKLKAKTEELLKKAGAEKTAELLIPWDILSEENGGVCVRAEQDGVSLFDLPELLKDAGMYSAGVV